MGLLSCAHASVLHADDDGCLHACQQRSHAHFHAHQNKPYAEFARDKCTEIKEWVGKKKRKQQEREAREARAAEQQSARSSFGDGASPSPRRWGSRGSGLLGRPTSTRDSQW